METKENRIRVGAENAAVAGLYLILGIIGLPQNINGVATSSLVWPASGFALAVILIGGVKQLPGLALGALGVALYARHDPVLTAFYMVAVPAQAWIGATMMRRLTHFQNEMGRLQDVVGLVIFGAILSPVIGTTLGTVGIGLGSGHWFRFTHTWLIWWIGDLMGILVVSPFILTFFGSGRRHHLRKNAPVGIALLLGAGLLAFLGFSHSDFFSRSSYATAYLVYPVAMWAALNYGSRGASLTTLVVALVAVAETMLQQTPFIPGQSPALSLFYLWLFLGVLAATSLTLAAVAMEREKARDIALAARLQLQTFIEHTPAAVAMFDREMRYLAFSRRWLKDYHLRESDILGKSHYEVFPEIPEEWKSDHRRVLQGEIYRQEQDSFPRRDGTIDWIRYELLPWRTPDGAIGGIIMATEVITERKQAEDALRASEIRYRNLVAKLPGAIYRCQCESHRAMESLSAYIEDLTGYLPHELEEIADGGFERIIHPEDREPAWRSLEEQLARSGQYIIEYRIVRKDGSERHILDKGSRSPTSGPAVSLCLDGVLFDMTERKLWEAEHLRASKLESIGKLAGGIAHDFNNILTEINGNIEMALLGGINRDSMAAQALLEAKTACERATEVARQLLTFSKGGTPVKKIGRLGEIARKAADFSLHGSHCSCELVLPSDLWPAEVDAEQISQALQNMIVNAAQAMPQGGSITILLENVPADQIKEGRSQLRPGPHVRLSIEDRGTGIDRSILPRIFDPYFTTKPNGSGLGLSTSFSIIHRHDGGVFVDSVPGKGSVFRIYLPALPEVSREVTLSAAASLPVGGGRVLIMDDEHGIQRLLEAMLRRMGYEVTITDDGEEAIERFREALEQKQPFRFALLDLTIPGGMGGKTAITRLRELDPNLIALVVSGYSDDPIMANCREYGFTSALAKPFSFQSLHDALGTLEMARGVVKV